MLKYIHHERIRKIIKIAIVISLLTSVEIAYAERARFDDPQVNGYALDLCREWANNCGKPAADAYCRSQGYVEAVDYVTANDNPPTRIIGTGQVCDQPECDRIVSVVCTDRHHRNRHHPRY